MTARPIKTIPAYIRTGYRSAPGYNPQRVEALREVVESAPTMVGLLAKGIFGTAADRASQRIVDEYSRFLSDAIENDLFKGVLFETAIYNRRDTGQYGTYVIKMIRAGDTPQDALERDYFLKEKLGPAYKENPIDSRKLLYSNNDSYFIFISKDPDGDGYVAVRISNPTMLRNVAKAAILEGTGRYEREILESQKIVQINRKKIRDARREQKNELVRLQIESLARRRIDLENKMVEARELIREAEAEQRHAAVFGKIGGVLSILASGLKFADGLTAAGVAGDGSGTELEYEPTLNLHYDFVPNIDVVPNIQEGLRNLELEAADIDNRLL